MEAGGEGELCCSHAGDQKRCHWEKSSRLVSFCFFGSRRPDALWMFVFFGLLSRARRFRPNIRDMHRVQDAETKGQKVRFTTKIYQALRDSVVLEKKEIAGNTRPQAPSSLWTFDECARRRPAIEAVAARPRRGAGANKGPKLRLSRCVASAALPGAVRRPPRCCPAAAARRGAPPTRRCPAQCAARGAGAPQRAAHGTAALPGAPDTLRLRWPAPPPPRRACRHVPRDATLGHALTARARARAAPRNRCPE